MYVKLKDRKTNPWSWVSRSWEGRRAEGAGAASLGREHGGGELWNALSLDLDAGDTAMFGLFKPTDPYTYKRYFSESH